MNSTAVLVVDDTKSILHLLGYFLADIVDHIVTARDGLEAMQIVEEYGPRSLPFNLILMDLNMPRMSGNEAARRMRSRGVTIPLIAMTAGGLTADDCYAAGFTGYMTKPFDYEQFIISICTYLSHPSAMNRGSEHSHNS